MTHPTTCDCTPCQLSQALTRMTERAERAERAERERDEARAESAALREQVTAALETAYNHRKGSEQMTPEQRKQFESMFIAACNDEIRNGNTVSMARGDTVPRTRLDAVEKELEAEKRMLANLQRDARAEIERLQKDVEDLLRVTTEETKKALAVADAASRYREIFKEYPKDTEWTRKAMLNVLGSILAGKCSLRPGTCESCHPVRQLTPADEYDSEDVGDGAQFHEESGDI
jgi:hypothetical protein